MLMQEHLSSFSAALDENGCFVMANLIFLFGVQICFKIGGYCYALKMITVVIETFARCQLYRLLWP